MFKQSHFELVGAVIADMRNRDPSSTEVLDGLIDDFADKFEKLNPRFDRKRFNAVCGRTTIGSLLESDVFARMQDNLNTTKEE